MMHKELLRSAKSVEKVYNRLCEKVSSKYDITKLELAVLRCLEVHPNGVARDIVDILHVSKSAVSQAIDELMEKGLLFGRHREDDRRYVALELQEPAKKILAEVDEISNEFQKVLDAGIPKEDIEVFQKTLKCILKNIVDLSNKMDD